MGAVFADLFFLFVILNFQTLFFQETMLQENVCMSVKKATYYVRDIYERRMKSGRLLSLA